LARKERVRLSESGWGGEKGRKSVMEPRKGFTLLSWGKLETPRGRLAGIFEGKKGDWRLLDRSVHRLKSKKKKKHGLDYLTKTWGEWWGGIYERTKNAP